MDIYLAIEAREKPLKTSASKLKTKGGALAQRGETPRRADTVGVAVGRHLIS
ncbi:MAG: hypothetical protein OXE94_02120 [Aestuariivita sp.]|nr:hypothetical protein [Aestuariivita sp.]MCY4201179.1 hypothetical protein [Aestuariivita sp.]